jgi:hypothetical protein
MVSWLHVSGPGVRQNIMVLEACGGGGSSPQGGQEVERKRRNQRSNISCKDTPTMIHPPPPANPFLLKYPQIVPVAGDQAFNTWTCGGNFSYLNHEVMVTGSNNSCSLST